MLILLSYIMTGSISKFTVGIFNLESTHIENKNLDNINYYYRLISESYDSISYNV